MTQSHEGWVRSVQALRGPSLHANLPVLHATLRIGTTGASDDGPDYAQQLRACLPGVCLQREATSNARLAGALVAATLELQRLVGFAVTYGAVRPTAESDTWRAIIAYEEEEPARAALDAAEQLLLAAMHGEPFDTTGAIERLQVVGDEYRLGPSTAAIVAAARRRDIPITRLTPRANMVQFGYGVYQCRIQAGATSLTSAMASNIAQDKALTNRLLRDVYIPVPHGSTAESADAAWDAAQSLGLPVVVKPQAGNQGKGVSVNLATEDEVRAAYALASAYGRRALVERHVPGDDYRLLVVGGALVAAARRAPAQVVGNGVRSVAELVALANQDPRRRPGHGGSLTRIALNEAADLVLAQQGLTRDAVPTAGQVVLLRNNANLSTGGTATDVTDSVHPANARLAQLAARVVGLDIAGIDMLCQDIGRPLAEQGGAIVEVNAAPGLRMHLDPATGQPRDVGAPIVGLLYAEGAPSRVPVIAITGTNGKTTVTRLIAHLFRSAGMTVGMTTTEGVYVGDERIATGDCSGPQSARAVLLHPQVEAAVLETARGGILREGLAFDGCHVAVVTNISPDHLGLGGIETLDDLARVKEVVVRAARPGGAAVLNADDPRVAAMAAASKAPAIFFSADASNPVVIAHLAAQGRAVVAEGGAVVLAQAGERVPLLPLADVPYALGGAVPFLVQNVLAGTAAAWGAGLAPAQIARGLRSFAATPELVPGRFNVIALNGVQIVLDYGHNVGALAAVAQGVVALGPRRTVVAMCLPGDRRDDDLRATVAQTLPFGDEYVLYDLRNRRKRAENEVPNLLRSVIPPAIPVTIVPDQDAALHAAWERVCAGERLVLLAAESERAIRAIRALEASTKQLEPQGSAL